MRRTFTLNRHFCFIHCCALFTFGTLSSFVNFSKNPKSVQGDKVKIWLRINNVHIASKLSSFYSLVFSVFVHSLFCCPFIASCCRFWLFGSRFGNRRKQNVKNERRNDVWWTQNDSINTFDDEFRILCTDQSEKSLRSTWWRKWKKSTQHPKIDWLFRKHQNHFHKMNFTSASRTCASVKNVQTRLTDLIQLFFSSSFSCHLSVQFVLNFPSISHTNTVLFLFFFFRRWKNSCQIVYIQWLHLIQFNQVNLHEHLITFLYFIFHMLLNVMKIQNRISNNWQTIFTDNQLDFPPFSPLWHWIWRCCFGIHCIWFIQMTLLNRVQLDDWQIDFQVRSKKRENPLNGEKRRQRNTSCKSWKNLTRFIFNEKKKIDETGKIERKIKSSFYRHCQST